MDTGTIDEIGLIATGPRERRGMKTVCDRCRRKIKESTDPQFVLVLRTGHKNAYLHIGCLGGDERAMLAASGEQEAQLKEG